MKPITIATVGLLLLGIEALPVANSAETRMTNNSLTEFKQFIALPPTIGSVVYRTITAADRSKGLPSIEGVWSPHDHVGYFMARWQSNCIFIKSGTNWNVAQPGRTRVEEINTRFHDEYWRLTPPGILTYWQDPGQSMAEVRPGPPLVHHVRTSQLRELMNMGIMSVEVGALSWHDNAFTAEGYIPEWKAPEHVSGHLVTDTKGYPKELDIQYANQNGVFNFVARYLYARDIGVPFLPSTIQVYLVSQTNLIQLEQFDILSIQTQQQPMDRSFFDLQSMAATNKMPTILYTNGAYYAKNLVGGWAPVATVDGNVAGFLPVKGIPVGNIVYFYVAVTSAIVTFSIVWRIAKNKKQEIQSTI